MSSVWDSLIYDVEKKYGVALLRRRSFATFAEYQTWLSGLGYTSKGMFHKYVFTESTHRSKNNA